MVSYKKEIPINICRIYVKLGDIHMWSVVGTWPFSLQLSEKAAKMLASGAKAMDALEAGVHLVESDPNVDSVGRGGYLNANGELELDAAVMDGDTLKMGCVAGVRGFEHPVTIARKVMEETIHSILVGPGAEEFARKMGIPEVGNDYMVTETARKAWELKKQEGHDTIGSVALDSYGSMGVAMSTSGANMKVPGRVGDTPIIGSGFYVESGVGGAAATGLGEDIMRTCLAFRVVELMRQGWSPKAAADEVILTAHNKIKAHGIEPDNMAIVCMNAQGESAAACNHQCFYYSHAREGQRPVLEPVKPIIDNGRCGGGSLGFLESQHMEDYYSVVDNAGLLMNIVRPITELPKVNECRPAVALWVVNDKGQYLLTKDADKWQVPYGMVIAGEDQNVTVQRVLREQLGLDPDAIQGNLWKLVLEPIAGCEGHILYFTWVFHFNGDVQNGFWFSAEEITAMDVTKQYLEFPLL